jgi:DNA-binding CsgD family transcriptional regulator
MDRQSNRMDQLERIVTATDPVLVAKEPPSTHRPVIRPSAVQQTTNPRDVDTFSPQERNILAVFFENRDMALSYADIARALKKSPHTIKNQLRQMTLKTDLFDKALDRENRNRFRLKEGLRLKKYFDMNRNLVHTETDLAEKDH